MKPLKTIDVTYAGRTVALPDESRYAKFYSKLSVGTWEPGTFEVLGRNLDKETIYVDMGSWIGVTPLWAAHIAKSVVAVEPDPICIEILNHQSASYPNLVVVHGALASSENVELNSVNGFGNSASSVLGIGTGESVVVKGHRIDEIMKSVGQAPVFVKIDIEGYEYDLSKEIEKLRKYNLRGLQLAVQPQLFEKSLRGNCFARRWQAVAGTRKIACLFREFLPEPKVIGYRSLLSYLVFGILFTFKPKGTDLVFEREVLPQ